MLSLFAFAFLSCRPFPTPSAEALPERLYVIDWGDSLWGIATQYNVPGGYMALARLNGIRHPDYVEAGWKIKVPSNDTSLPEWPRLTRARAALNGCAVQATAPVRAMGAQVACTEVPGGTSVCARQTPEGLSMYVAGPRAQAWNIPVDETSAWWLDEDAPWAPGATLGQQVGLRVQLDDDPTPETAVGWKIEENNLGMSRWQVVLLDNDDPSRAVSFEAANFGPGSFVSTPAGGCEVLASEWVLGTEPGGRSTGYYLVARTMAFERGQMVHRGKGVLSRRLYDSFRPAAVSVAGVHVGSVVTDLADSRAAVRSLEPDLEVRRIDQAVQRGVRSSTDASGRVWLDVDGVSQVVGGPHAALRRWGDRETGLLFPRGYSVVDPASLLGAGLFRATYQPPWWGELWSVLWV